MYIVFDIGGTTLRLANSADGKTINEIVTFPTPKNFDSAFELLNAEITKLSGGQPITGIAGGLPGTFNKDKTKIIRAANLPDWSEKPLAEKLTEAFNCPVKLENDCAVGALGEYTFGAGQGCESMAYIAVGTGIGGAWVLNNKLVQGSYSFRMGHHIIDPNGPICPSHQQPGHLEAYIKEPGFEKYFAIGLYNTLLYWPADVVILGGGVVLHGNWDLAALKNELQELFKPNTQNVEIKIAALGDEAGLHGAFTLL